MYSYSIDDLRDLRMTLLQFIRKERSVSLKMLVDVAYEKMQQKLGKPLEIEPFQMMTINILQEMYDPRKNWIECNFDGMPEESGDLRSMFTWSNRYNLNITITRRGRKQITDTGKQVEVIFSGASTDSDDYGNTMYLEHDNMVSLIDSCRFPKLAKSLLQERILIAKSIKNRRGQAKFRQDLIDIYGQCLITGCTYTPILEAAHIFPYSLGGGFEPENGLLLRSDIHTLFDLGLISVYISNNQYKIIINELLIGTDYICYSNEPLSFPPGVTFRPDEESLEHHRLRADLDYLCD